MVSVLQFNDNIIQKRVFFAKISEKPCLTFAKLKDWFCINLNEEVTILNLLKYGKY